jgi:oligoribonuclease (3'-5' exoribonuclease)
MKYCSIDTETSGLNPSNCQILMASFIVEDSNNLLPLEELPHLTFFINHGVVEGGPYALAMNSWILDIIAGRKPNTNNIPIFAPINWEEKVQEFLTKHFGTEKITVAGKNLGTFDLQFLSKNLRSRFSHRLIDPSMLFTNFKTDSKPLSLDECKKRAGIEGVVSHSAYDDALDIIKVLRTKY